MTKSFQAHITTIYGKSKDGKARKDHVIQTFWYKFKICNFSLSATINFIEGRDYFFMISSTEDDF